eukprot:Rhum_TRINITY_DN14584_c20_g1::Rhum_TRINITY_DN14584_c20_g1_i1::g.100120::m.100120/K13103/TFIP11; tuftelin-interacting protein 11
MQGLGYAGSSDDGSERDVSSGSEDVDLKRAQDRKQAKRAKNREAAWMGDDDGYSDEGGGGRGGGRGGKSRGGGAKQKKRRDDENVAFVSSSAKKGASATPSPSPSPSPTPAEDSAMPPLTFAKATISLAQPELPPMTFSKATIEFCDPKEAPPVPKPRIVSAREESESLGFVAGGGKAKNKIMAMMKKAGWTPGRGMGKHEQGRSEAVAVKVRPKGAGVGTIDEKTEQQKRMDRRLKGLPEEPEDRGLTAANAPMVEEYEEAEDNTRQSLRNVKLQKQRAERNAWRKKKRALEDAITSLSRSPSPAPGGGVLDLTGGRGRPAAPEGDMADVHTVYEDAKGAYLKDVRVSLSRMLDQTERTLHTLDPRITSETRVAEGLRTQLRDAETRRETQKNSIETTEVLCAFFEKLQQRVTQGRESGDPRMNPSALGQALYGKLRAEAAPFADVAKFWSESINQLMVTMVLPMFGDAHASGVWAADPVNAPEYLLDDFLVWKRLLSEGDGLPLFFDVSWEVVGSKLRDYLGRKWRPTALDTAQDHERIIHLLETWQGVLSPTSFSYLVDNCVGSKLLDAVKQFRHNEGTSTAAFVLPWTAFEERSGLLAERRRARVASGGMLEEKGVLEELQTQLSMLMPSHSISFSYNNLLPLRGVMQHRAYASLVDKHVKKRVVDYLTAFTFDPASTSGLAAKTVQLNFKGIFSWCEADRAVAASTAKVLQTTFFPKLTYVVACYLRESRGRSSQAVAYYKGVRALFSSFVNAGSDAISHGLGTLAALILQAREWWAGKEAAPADAEEGTEEDDVFDLRAANQQAASLVRVAALAQRLNAGKSADGRPAAATTVARDRIVSDETQKTLKESVEEYASMTDLPFRPKRGSTQLGKQVYHLGKLLVYFDTSCLFLYEEGAWKPVKSIGDVLAQAAALEAKKARIDPTPAPAPAAPAQPAQPTPDDDTTMDID